MSTISEDDVIEIVQKYSRGELTYEQAQAEITRRSHPSSTCSRSSLAHAESADIDALVDATLRDFGL